MPAPPLAFPSFASWLAENPAPDLQTFINEHGSHYRRITPEIWSKWDYAVAQWQSRRSFWPWIKS